MSILNAENTIDRIIGFWQTEDLLRAYRFDIDQLSQKQFGQDPDKAEEALGFLKELKEAMEKEEVLEKGHTRHSMVLIDEKEARHNDLLANNTTYAESFNSIKQAVTAYNQQQNTNAGPVAVLFELLYAYYLKRLSGDDKSDQVQQMAEHAGACISQLYS